MSNIEKTLENEMFGPLKILTVMAAVV